jgi:DnaJ-class molecular chaperone
MARATFVKAARKDYPAHGIKAGESYWWWKFRYGGKYFSKSAPTRSQLTQSSFYSQLYDIQDRVAALVGDENLPDEVESIASDLRDLASECEDNRSNMPDQLQDSDTGQLLEERAQALNDAADALEGIDFDMDFNETADCTACDGSGEVEVKAETDTEDAEHGQCEECSGSGEVDNQDAADEYWQDKLQEVQDVDLDVS